jgi:putative FmdB family regulatory protein
MPLYEYHCNDCGEDFDKMVRFSEADRTQACPKCESQETHKKISVAASFGSFGSSLSSAGSSSSSSSCGSRGGFS